MKLPSPRSINCSDWLLRRRPRGTWGMEGVGFRKYIRQQLAFRNSHSTAVGGKSQSAEPGRTFALLHHLTRGRVEASLFDRRFEEFNGTAERIVDKNLSAADARDNGVAEMNPFLLESVYGGSKISDLDCEPVPASRLGLGAVWHRLAPAARGVRGAEHQASVASWEHGEGWAGL
jgi:hypothetical protein